MCACISFVLSTVACLYVIGAAPVMDQHQLQLKEHYDHLAYIGEFKCRTPQPRTIAVHKLLPVNEMHGKAYFPDVTVLHRCDCETGACPSGHECGVRHKEQVHLPLKVTYLQGMDDHKKGSWEIEYYYFDNHTECGCVVSSPIDDRQDSVPSPVHIIHQHYVVPNLDQAHYEDILASIPAIEANYNERAGLQSQPIPQESSQHNVLLPPLFMPMDSFQESNKLPPKQDSQDISRGEAHREDSLSIPENSAQQSSQTSSLQVPEERCLPDT